jgi:hypothetical protein
MFSKKQKNIDWNKRGIVAGSHIKQYASKLSIVILNNDTEKSKDEFAGTDLLTITSAVFYLSLDREAFSKLIPADRIAFSDGMLFEIISGLSRLWNQPREVFPTIANELNKVLEKLAPFTAQLLPEKDESPQGTLYWEFMKILVNDYGVEHRAALQANMHAMTYGTELWKDVKEQLEL